MLRALFIVAALVLAADPPAAKADLVLLDGTVLKGKSAERRGDLFLLRLEDDTVAAIPAANVKELRLLDEPATAPTGFRVTPPETVAGTPPATPANPSAAELLGAFPEREAAPRPAPIPSGWTPTDALAGRGGNDFNPARWYRAPIDPTWVPTPAFTSKTDVTNFRPARWTKVIESIWVPKDGFADAVSNPRRNRPKAGAVPKE